MTVIRAQSRLQLEKSIGYNLGAIRISETTSTGTTLVLNDTTLFGGTNNFKGKWVHVSDSAGPTGDVRQVKSNDTTVALTLAGALSSSSTGSMEYILWDEDMPPARIHEFIDRAVRTITRRGAPPLEDTTIHTGGDMYRFNLKDSVSGIAVVRTRTDEVSVSLLPCDSVWDESSATSMVTIALEDEDCRQGSASVRFLLAAAADTATVLATDSISASDLSGYTHIEFWFKATCSAAAGAVKLLLDNSTGCASPTETLSVPQTDSGTWTYHRVPLAAPWNDTAIVSIGLKQGTDLGAERLWFDDIRAMKDGSEIWEDLHPTQWRIERDGRKLALTPEGKNHAGYSLLQLVGYKKPTELTSDTAMCDVEPEYLIEKATAMALRARGDRSADRRDAAWDEATRREGLAQLSFSSMVLPRNVRWCDD